MLWASLFSPFSSSDCAAARLPQQRHSRHAVFSSETPLPRVCALPRPKWPISNLAAQARFLSDCGFGLVRFVFFFVLGRGARKEAASESMRHNAASRGVLDCPTLVCASFLAWLLRCEASNDPSLASPYLAHAGGRCYGTCLLKLHLLLQLLLHAACWTA